ncbi:hypothetical protein RB594_007553 [Gaeumannomyces avenae]
MSSRGIYLAVYRRSTSQRAHFAIFIPNASHDRQDVAQTFRAQSTTGTIIHVVGEPAITGFALEFKRNYECSTSSDLKKLVPLGQVSADNVYDPPSTVSGREATPRGTLEKEATKISPPKGGQNIRDSVDGVTTKRCQEWTMEYLNWLVQTNYIHASAVETAQAERDPGDFGIFGKKKG